MEAELFGCKGDWDGSECGEEDGDEELLTPPPKERCVSISISNYHHFLSFQKGVAHHAPEIRTS
jgi:hypothetical protein